MVSSLLQGVCPDFGEGREDMGNDSSKMICPKCGSDNVDVQVIQENQGSVTKTYTKSKYKEKGRGCLWWCFVGWWWWIIELFLWIFAFIPMALLRIGRKKKYKGSSTSKEVTSNKIKYQRMFVCKDCGHYWKG